jgi:hypothetical protein
MKWSMPRMPSHRFPGRFLTLAWRDSLDAMNVCWMSVVDKCQMISPMVSPCVLLCP